MKKLLILGLIAVMLPLVGCSASIGTPSRTTTYTTTTPTVSSTAYVAPASRTTVTRTTTSY